jgi:hypothetical protein
MESLNGLHKTNRRGFFSKLVESKLLGKKRLTREELRYMISISYTDAELLRRDSQSRQRKSLPRVNRGITQVLASFLFNLKTSPQPWFKKINGVVEDGCLVIKD